MAYQQADPNAQAFLHANGAAATNAAAVPFLQESARSNPLLERKTEDVRKLRGKIMNTVRAGVLYVFVYYLFWDGWVLPTGVSELSEAYSKLRLFHVHERDVWWSMRSCFQIFWRESCEDGMRMSYMKSAGHHTNVGLCPPFHITSGITGLRPSLKLELSGIGYIYRLPCLEQFLAMRETKKHQRRLAQNGDKKNLRFHNTNKLVKKTASASETDAKTLWLKF